MDDIERRWVDEYMCMYCKRQEEIVRKELAEAFTYGRALRRVAAPSMWFDKGVTRYLDLDIVPHEQVYL